MIANIGQKVKFKIYFFVFFLHFFTIYQTLYSYQLLCCFVYFSFKTWIPWKTQQLFWKVLIFLIQNYQDLNFEQKLQENHHLSRWILFKYRIWLNEYQMSDCPLTKYVRKCFCFWFGSMKIESFEFFCKMSAKNKLFFQFHLTKYQI